MTGLEIGEAIYGEGDERVQFNSNHEGYAFVLQQYEAAVIQLERVKMDVDFLWLNVKKGNFNDPVKKGHALKELRYLEVSADCLADSAARLKNLARELKAQNEGEGRHEEPSKGEDNQDSDRDSDVHS